MRIEAKYYKKLNGDKVKCTLCPHNCILKDGQTGICNTRQNSGGILYSLAYAAPFGLAVDPVEKKPLFHFLPAHETLSFGTVGCNLSCKHCQNHHVSKAKPSESAETITPEDIVNTALRLNLKSISYTYTDPVAFYEFTLETAKIAKQAGLKNILVSAGYINSEPLNELIPYIDAANIDIKAFRDATYRWLTGGKLSPVLETIKRLKNENVWLELTYLLIPRINDSSEEIEQLCSWLRKNNFSGTPLHFTRFYPAFKMKDRNPTNLSTLNKAYNIAKESGLEFVYLGNVLQTDKQHTYCPNCGKPIIIRNIYNIENINIKSGKCNFCNFEIKGVW